MAYWLARSFNSQSLEMFRALRAPAERVSGTGGIPEKAMKAHKSLALPHLRVLNSFYLCKTR